MWLGSTSLVCQQPGKEPHRNASHCRVCAQLTWQCPEKTQLRLQWALWKAILAIRHDRCRKSEAMSTSGSVDPLQHLKPEASGYCSSSTDVRVPTGQRVPQRRLILCRISGMLQVSQEPCSICKSSSACKQSHLVGRCGHRSR